MAELAFWQDHTCQSELRPSLPPQGGEVVELTVNIDHRLAHLACQLISYLIPTPRDLEFRRGKGEGEHLWSNLRQAREERRELELIVADAIRRLPVEGQKKGARRRPLTHFWEARRLILTISRGDELMWLRKSHQLYPTLEAWTAVVKIAETAAYERFFAHHGRFPAPGSKEELAVDGVAHLARQVVVALVPPEVAARLA